MYSKDKGGKGSSESKCSKETRKPPLFLRKRENKENGGEKQEEKKEVGGCLLHPCHLSKSGTRASRYLWIKTPGCVALQRC